MKTEFSPNNLPVKSPPPRQRGLTFSPKSAARPENEEIQGSPEVQRDIKRTFSLCQTRPVKGNPTRERGLRSHARRNCTANLTPTTRPMNWLLGEKNAPGTLIITPPPPSCPFHTNQQTASLPRRGYEDHQGMAGRGGGGGGPQGLRGCWMGDSPSEAGEGRRRRMGNPVCHAEAETGGTR